MKNSKSDRRSERTRRSLEDALVALFLEKRYTDISVQDILDRANVGRSTFYEHYWDKDDLLGSELERMVDLLSGHTFTAAPTVPALIPALALFRHVQDQQHLYQALLRGRGLEICVQTLQLKLSILVEERLCNLFSGYTQDEQLIAATASCVAGAFMALLQWWLSTDMALEPERLDALYQQLMVSGIGGLRQQAPEVEP